MKIGIVTRSMNYDLYQMSSGTISLPYSRKRYRLCTADGYFYKLLKSNYDVVINIDEDAFVLDNEKLKGLLEYCLDNGYVNCGLPDGGVLEIRDNNPLVTNPFFNILNLNAIREKFDINEVLSYSEHKAEYESKVPWHLINEEYRFDSQEPFVPFFLWLSQNFKILYLNGEKHEDGISTVLKDQSNEPFLVHSWYSRFYGKDEFHTRRIDSLYTQAKPSVLYKKSGIKRAVIKKIEYIEYRYLYGRYVWLNKLRNKKK